MLNLKTVPTSHLEHVDTGLVFADAGAAGAAADLAPANAAARASQVVKINRRREHQVALAPLHRLDVTPTRKPGA